MDEFGRKDFWIDFSGYCKIRATDAETAEEIFWSMVMNEHPLPHALYEVEGREEAREG